MNTETIEAEIFTLIKSQTNNISESQSFSQYVERCYRNNTNNEENVVQPFTISFLKLLNYINQRSKDKMFQMVLTPVIIPGGDPVEYSGTWHFSSELDRSSKYEARGVFIASSQEISEIFEIKPEVCENCEKRIARILRCRELHEYYVVANVRRLMFLFVKNVDLKRFRK